VRNNHLATCKISLNLAQIISNKRHQPQQVHKVKAVFLSNKNFKCNNSNRKNSNSSSNRITALIAMSKDQLLIFYPLRTSLSLVKITVTVQMFSLRIIKESNLMLILEIYYALTILMLKLKKITKLRLKTHSSRRGLIQNHMDSLLNNSRTLIQTWILWLIIVWSKANIIISNNKWWQTLLKLC